MNQVILYGTHCPRCNVLAKKLESKGIAFTENTNTDEMLSMGMNEVPVLSVDGKLLQFAEANSWINEQVNT